MVVNAIGEMTTTCQICNTILGKGSGYNAEMTREQEEKWFEGIELRKKEK